MCPNFSINVHSEALKDVADAKEKRKKLCKTKKYSRIDFIAAVHILFKATM